MTFSFSFKKKRKIENVQKESSDKGKDKWQKEIYLQNQTF